MGKTKKQPVQSTQIISNYRHSEHTAHYTNNMFTTIPVFYV